MPTREELTNAVKVNRIEQVIKQEFLFFENEIRKTFGTLPILESRAIYNICPYFENKEIFFQRGLKKIVNAASRVDKNYTEDIKDSLERCMYSWFSAWGYNHWGDGDYELGLDAFFEPYITAFESVTANSEVKIRNAKESLSPKTQSRYGYITNDFTALLLYETTKAVFESLDEVIIDRKAWDSVLIPQNQIHTKLSQVWKQNFESGFMKKVISMHEEIIDAMLEELCYLYELDFDEYAELIGTKEFKQMLQKESETLEREKESLNEIKQKEIQRLKDEILNLDAVIAECGKSIFGEKARRRKYAIGEKERILQELSGIEHPVPISRAPIDFVIYDLSKARLYEKSDEWPVEYNETKKRYVVYTPKHVELCVLSEEFTRRYNKFRKLGANIEGWSTCYQNNNPHHLEISLTLFEKNN